MCNLLFNVSLNEFDYYYCFNHERRKPKISLQFTNMLFFKTKYLVLLPYLESSTHHVAGIVLSVSWTAFFAKSVSLFSVTITAVFNNWNDFSRSELGRTQEMPSLTTRWQSWLGEQSLLQAPKRRLFPQAGDRETSAWFSHAVRGGYQTGSTHARQSNMSLKGIQPFQTHTVRIKLCELSSCDSFQAAGRTDEP